MQRFIYKRSEQIYEKKGKIASFLISIMTTICLLSTNIIFAEEFIYYGYTTNPIDGSLPSTDNHDYYMTKDGTNPIRVYCINHNAEAPYADNYEMAKKENLVYKKVIANQELLEQNVQANKYGSELEKNIRKIFFYLYKNKTTSLISNRLIWKASGANIALSGQEEALYNKIISGDEVPHDFIIELYIPRDASKQTLARGYLNETVKPESTIVRFSKQDIAGQELIGAIITLTSDNGEKPQEWKSNGKVHEFNVKKGHYAFVESKTPDNSKYEIAAEITFDVEYNDIENRLEIKNISLGEGNKQLSDGTFVMVDKAKEPEFTFDESNEDKISDSINTGDSTEFISAIITTLVASATAVIFYKKIKGD